MAGQGEYRITGVWRQDTRRVRQQIYAVAGGGQEIRQIGEAVASAAQVTAQSAATSSSAARSDLLLVPTQVSFKDIRQFTIKKNAAVSKRGDQILVGLVVADHPLSLALEFGAQTRRGAISAAAFMRSAALKIAGRGYRFQPAKPDEQQKALAKAQTQANRVAKKVSTRNRRAARTRSKGNRR
jgi:hypothetical protein